MRTGIRRRGEVIQRNKAAPQPLGRRRTVRLCLLAACCVLVLAVMPVAAQAAPSVVSESASQITASTATLEATIATQPAEDVITQFQLATSPGELPPEFRCPRGEPRSVCIPDLPGETPFPVQDVFPPGESVSLSLAGIVTLSPGTTYYYRILAAKTIVGGDQLRVEPPVVYGPIQSFTTVGPPPAVTHVEPAGGPAVGGIHVTITGTHLNGATSVKFGSSAAPSFTATETSITTVSPPGTGTVDVTVTTPNGTSATSEADRFTYGPPAAKQERLYVTNGVGHHISLFNLGPEGQLLENNTLAFPNNVQEPHTVVVGSDGNSLYVGTNETLSGTVSQFTVASNGTLTLKEPPWVPTEHEPQNDLALSPDGKSLYAADSSPAGQPGAVTQYTVGPGGLLTLKTPPTVAAGKSGATGIVVAPNGASAYATNFDANTISQFSVGAGGVLSPLKPATVASGASPAGIAVSPDGSSLYVVDSAVGGGSSAISQYSIGAGGKLSPKTPATVPTGGEPWQVAVSPDGKSVYVSDRVEKGEISQYTVEPGGALTPKSPPSVAAERQPEGLAISPDGKSLYVAETISNTVSQYRIEASGNLTLLATARTGEDPRSIAFASKPQLPPPTVETKAASSVTQTTATLNATVNPNGGNVGECKLEYGTTTSYGSSAACSPSPGSGESPVAVSASVSGLSPNTSYHFRISATNALGTSTGSDETLKTTCSAGGFCTSFTPETEGKAFNQPDAVALDPSGDIWVADSGHDRVLEFNKERKFLRQFGTVGIGAGQYEGIAGNGIAGIATNSSGDVYVTGSDRVQEFSPTGEFLRQWGSPGSGFGQFLYPNGIAVDASGNVWVVDTFNYRVQEFSESGAFLNQFGSPGTGNGQLGWASGLAFSGGNLYVADSGRVEEFSTAGAYIGQFGSSGTGNGQFHGLGGIASDPTTGNLYVSDVYNNRVQEFSASGAFIAVFGSGGSGNGQFSGPRGLAVNSSGTLFVADAGNNRMEEWVGTP